MKYVRFADKLIKRFAGSREEEIVGDLLELYHLDQKRLGSSGAARKYLFNTLGFFTKQFFWKSRKKIHHPSHMIFKSYFTMAVRALLAHRGTAALNIAGLVIGITSALVIASVIRFEKSFDKFHSNNDQIYRVVRVSGEDMSEFRTGVSYPVPKAIREQVTAVQNVASIEYFGGVDVEVVGEGNKKSEKFREERGCTIIQPEFFQMFDFKGSNFHWVHGNPSTALADPFNVVLTQSLAKKFFGEADAIGRTIKLQGNIECKVTGVVTDFPANTDFPFTLMVAYKTLEVFEKERFTNWYSVNDSHHVYIKKAEGSSTTEIENQIAKIQKTNAKDLDTRHYLLQKLAEVHTDPRFGTFSGRTISTDALMGLSLVAILPLGAASINYINLSTAQSVLRAKEIGIRKTLGSSRRSLSIQFITETFVLVFIASIIALGLMDLLLFKYQSLLNFNYTPYNFLSRESLVSVLFIIVAVTVFSSFYPALMISRFSPVAALKSKFNIDAVGGINLRKILVVAQFTITQILVVGTFIVVAQMRHFYNKDMGFDEKAVINLKLPNNIADKLAVLENQLRSQNYVSNVSYSFTIPSGLNKNRSYQDLWRPELGPDTKIIYEYHSIDPSYLQLYDIELIAGRNLKEADSTGNVLVNEKMLGSLGFESPAQALGQSLQSGDKKLTIVGVIKNFYSNSLKEGVDNIAMEMNRKMYSYASIKLNAQGVSVASSVKGIEQIWKSIFPDHDITMNF
jgi:putative ABC transport system permease protein